MVYLSANPLQGQNNKVITEPISTIEKILCTITNGIFYGVPALKIAPEVKIATTAMHIATARLNGLENTGVKISE